MELFRRAQLLGTRDFRPFEALILAAAMYWALTTIFTYFQQRLERRMSKGYVRAGSFQLGGGAGGHAG
jgi:ABC-type amino acid transport system permease subunit